MSEQSEARAESNDYNPVRTAATSLAVMSHWPLDGWTAADRENATYSLAVAGETVYDAAQDALRDQIREVVLDA